MVILYLVLNVIKEIPPDVSFTVVYAKKLVTWIVVILIMDIMYLKVVLRGLYIVVISLKNILVYINVVGVMGIISR